MPDPVMTGHPADTTPTPAPAPAPEPKTEDTIAEIDVGGQKFVVDPALAAALKKTQRQEEDRYSVLQTNLQKLQDEVRQKGSPVPSEAPKDELMGNTDLLFSNPEAFLAKFQERIETKVKTELTTEYQRAEGRKQFWDTFYKTNDDIKRESQLLVDAVMNRDYEELAALPVGRQFEALGEKVREEMLKIVGKKKSDDSQSGPKPRLEGGSTPSPRPAPGATPQASNQVVSISDIVREKREARVKARTKQTA
jgi:hypothetical protein